MPKFLQYLLLPLSWIYGTIVWCRKGLFKSGIFTRSKFDFPIICVGNITAGGTGKTPHIEWLIEKLKPNYQVAVLSRGYKRKTNGYVLAQQDSLPSEIGDEPYQIKQKFKDVTVSVAENRVLGIPHLLSDSPDTQVILMDDGYQHLSIKAGFNIILCDYNRPYYNDFLLPSGLLRESAKGSNRADVIIVSKCPDSLNETAKNEIISNLKPLAHQKVYFSKIQYKTIQPLTQAAKSQQIPSNAIALAGIAKADLFISQLNKSYHIITSMLFADHHTYTDDDIQKIATLYKSHTDSCIITTEKDAVKLGTNEILKHIQHIPIWYLPIGIEVENGEALIAQVTNYIQHEIANASE